MTATSRGADCPSLHPHQPTSRPITRHTSSIRILLALLSCLLLFKLPHVSADADIDSVRIKYGYKDMSGKGGDPKGKYWHESIFHPHYDGRFTDSVLTEDDQRSNLSLLMQSYLFTMADLGAETWIIHGTLLGWWWNRKIMPWDSDIDVQMSASTVGFLASYYNMTVHRFHERDFMLEVNPNYLNGSYADNLNVIDARWIDVKTGLFIDITATRPVKGMDGIVSSKDKHSCATRDLFPLRESIFEGLPVLIPYNYAKVLTDEYGGQALVQTDYQGHTFNRTSAEWERAQVQAVVAANVGKALVAGRQ